MSDQSSFGHTWACSWCFVVPFQIVTPQNHLKSLQLPSQPINRPLGSPFNSLGSSILTGNPFNSLNLENSRGKLFQPYTSLQDCEVLFQGSATHILGLWNSIFNLEVFLQNKEPSIHGFTSLYQLEFMVLWLSCFIFSLKGVRVSLHSRFHCACPLALLRFSIHKNPKWHNLGHPSAQKQAISLDCTKH